MRETAMDRVRRILADTDPEMKRASDHAVLRKRVKVLLDGQDVTRVCRGFSIPAQRVELMVWEPGRKLFSFFLDWTCRCGTVRSRTRPASFGLMGICPFCGQEATAEVAIETRAGLVEVLPVEPAAGGAT